MLDHIGLVVTDLSRSTDFYIKALQPLGIALIVELTAAQTGDQAHAGFGRDRMPTFWIGTGHSRSGPIHVAVSAASRAQVDAFCRTALAAGGKDHGKPGLRPHYHADYYGAFVFDPDGNNVEAVCRTPA